MKVVVKFICFTLIYLTTSNTLLFSQGPTNTDPKNGYINVNTPKTPESACFEKYGNTQVNEFTGTTNISIPIYSLKSRFLESPITLAYQSNPIRVNQEASWVGLGFDLIAGGRITVETRGDVDFCSSYLLASPSNTALGMSQVFQRLGYSGENAVYTPATFCEPASYNTNCIAPPEFNGQAISDMTQFGVGEPDIFRANFLGHSVKFYVDKISNTIKFIGEKSFFSISYNLDTYHNINNWTIKDNEGITYLFEQTETTSNTLPTSPVVPGTTTSAWLLTKVLHPTGDYIQYTYSNFGPVVPAFSMSNTIDYMPNTATQTIPSETFQNVNIENSMYLTRMETSTVAVDFVLDTRTDLYGTGSRKLSQINVIDKMNNVIKRSATFSYSYFQNQVDPNSRTYLNNLIYSLPPNMSQSAYLETSNSRLKLNLLTLGGNGTTQPPFQFYYNGIVVDKYSLSQDHWGFYNGVNNSGNGYAFTHLIPSTFLGNPVVTNPAYLNALGGINVGFNRECDGGLMQAMVLNEIDYPTGGKSLFTYEPHQSIMSPTIQITGGGLRVKTIKNYIDGNLTGTTEYSYSGGKYMGAIKYITTADILGNCAGTVNEIHIRVSSNGTANANDILIGYNQVTINQKDNSSQLNGTLVKTFNITTASSNYSTNGAGVDIAPPYIRPLEVVPLYITPWIPNIFALHLNMDYKLLPPTPSSNLEGKLISENYYNSNNNLLKSVNYSYHLANYTNNFYCVRAIQNRVGGFIPPLPIPPSYTSCTLEDGNSSGGNRPVHLFVSPAKCFNAQIDSKIETNYSNGNAIATTENYTYDSYNQLKTVQTINSDGSSKLISFLHPIDDTYTYYYLMSAHMYSTIISTTETHNGNTEKVIKYNYFNPSPGVYVPQNLQVQNQSNTLETRELYTGYDNYGNLTEKQKPNGLKEIYLWGYDKKFLVATVLGSDYSTVSTLVDLSILNSPSSDAALRLELNKIRIALPSAIVTSYTYDPVYGISSETDSRGKTNFYIYDKMGRLALIRDQDNNVIKKFCYNYAGQLEDCTTPCPSNAPPFWQNTSTPVRCQQGTCGNTGYQEQEQRDMNICSSSYNSIQWINIGYNPTACSLNCVNLTSTNTYNTQGYVASYYNTATAVTYTFNVSTASGLQALGGVPAGNYTLTISRPVLGNIYSIFKSGCFKQTITDYSAVFYNVAVSASTCNSITVTMNVGQ